MFAIETGGKIVLEKMSVFDFYEIVMEEAAAELDKIFKSVADDIRTEIGTFITDRITSQPEYQSIISGRLHGELGLINPKKSIDAVINQMIKSTEVKNDPVRIIGAKSMTGGVIVNISPSNYADLLGLSEASYKSHQYDIPWLRWLLLEGNNILVAEYSVTTNLNTVNRKFSRSKKALMKKKKGSVWRVPAAFQGTKDDNFIIRAFSSQEGEDKFIELIENALNRNF